MCCFFIICFIYTLFCIIVVCPGHFLLLTSDFSTVLVYQNYECFRLLILNGARLHVPSNDRGFGRTLVTAVLRHKCDVRFLKLIAVCGGIRHGDKKHIDEAVAVFRQFNHGFDYSRKECLQFIDEWSGKRAFNFIKIS